MRLKNIVIIALLLSPILSSAQELPTLSRASEISAGTLANGIEYYVVSNPHTKGFADFSLVITPRIDDFCAREALDRLPHFGSRIPYRFFTDHRVRYSREGFIKQRSDASLYSFRDIPTHQQEVCDSSLLAIMDLAALRRSREAIIISGDVNSAQIIERLRLLSMIAPKLDPHSPDSSYKWTPSDGSDIAIRLNQSRNTAAISVIFRGERLRSELMNTPQALVTKNYSDILGRLICERADSALKARNIPFASLCHHYHDSSLSPSDEYFVIEAVSYAQFTQSIAAVLSSCLGEIDRKGFSRSEFERARRGVDEQHKLLSSARTNSDYTESCLAAFLYGSELASSATKAALFSKRLPIDTELPIFNSFAAAIIDSTRNLTLRIDSPSLQVDTAALQAQFTQNWNHSLADSTASPISQFSPEALISAESERKAQLTSLRSALADSRVKLTSEGSEPISGGKLWTFSNGMRVIFKHIDNSDGFQFALMLNGGLPALNGIKSGEAAFASDMLGLSRIGGMKAADFFDVLEQEGIYMSSAFTMQDFRITGHADKQRLPMLLRAFSIIANDREVDESQFAQFKQQQLALYDARSLYPIDPKPQIDSILRPNYLYQVHKNPYLLGEVLPYKVDKYLSSAFAQTNSGIIVLIGDLDEDNLKRYLPRVMGNFKTQKPGTHRYKINSRFVSSSISKKIEAREALMEYREKGVYMSLSAPVVYNITNRYAFELALEYMRDELAQKLSSAGAYLELSAEMEAFPSERMSVYIKCRPCFESGLPSSVEAVDPSELARILKSAIAGLPQTELSDARTVAYKNKLQGYLAEQQADTRTLMQALLTRYSSGKDVYSGAKDALAKLNGAKISEMLAALSAAVSIEYIVE